MKMKHVKTALIIILAIVVIIVILQNTASVETHVLFLKVTMPRAVLLLLSLTVNGAVMGLRATAARSAHG